jgi:hypothetical protein
LRLDLLPAAITPLVVTQNPLGFHRFRVCSLLGGVDPGGLSRLPLRELPFADFFREVAQISDIRLLDVRAMLAYTDVYAHRCRRGEGL